MLLNQSSSQAGNRRKLGKRIYIFLIRGKNGGFEKNASNKEI